MLLNDWISTIQFTKVIKKTKQLDKMMQNGQTNADKPKRCLILCPFTSLQSPLYVLSTFNSQDIAYDEII